MANLKSSKKQAKQNVVRRMRNAARNTALKSAVKRVLTAVASKESENKVLELFREAQAHIARARGKGLIHKNNAARKVSRLSRCIAKAYRPTAGHA